MGAMELNDDLDVVAIDGVNTQKHSRRDNPVGTEKEEILGAGAYPSIDGIVSGNVLYGVEGWARPGCTMNDVKH